MSVEGFAHQQSDQAQKKINITVVTDLQTSLSPVTLRVIKT